MSDKKWLLDDRWNLPIGFIAMILIVFPGFGSFYFIAYPSWDGVWVLVISIVSGIGLLIFGFYRLAAQDSIINDSSPKESTKDD